MQSFDQYLTKYNTRRFSKGELILCQGEVPPCVSVVKKGVVKSYNLSNEGDEKPIMFDVVGEVFPLSWVFKKLSTAPYFYEAYTDVEIYALPRDDYMDFLNQSTKNMQQALSSFAGRYAVHQMRINALEQSGAAQKIVSTLHFLCMRFGRNIKKDTVRIELPLTQQEFANFVGLTRETTGIELKKLQKRKIIDYRRQYYTVNTHKLNGMLDDEYDTWQLKDEKTLRILT